MNECGCKKFRKMEAETLVFCIDITKCLEIRCNTETGSGQQKDGRRACLVPGTGEGNSFHGACSCVYVRMQAVYLLN